MTKLRVLLCLTTRDNDYQREQAVEAERVAQSLDIALTIIDAGNDAINQSQLLLAAIQSKGAKPDAIIFEPVSGTGLPFVARAAAEAGIGWGILNREAEYLAELRRVSNSLVFGVGNDHIEVGRIQAAQIKNLLPAGGEVLLIEGPNENAAAHQRTEGFQEMKAANVTFRRLKGKWSQESGRQAIESWRRLCTSQQAKISAVVAHNDDMAVGARLASDDLPRKERERWAEIPFIGADGLSKAGQAWIGKGLLNATVLLSPVSGVALRTAQSALRSGERPPAYIHVTPFSYPDLLKVSSSSNGLWGTL